MDEVHAEIQALWRFPLTIKRLTKCTSPTCIDFPWKELFPNNQPKFPGCQDLGDAVADQARKSQKHPFIILTNHSDISFERQLTEKFYVAIINVDAYRKTMQDGPNRSAVFFLQVWEEVQELLVGHEELPLRRARLFKSLDDELQDHEEDVAEFVSSGGATVTAKLIRVASKAIKGSTTREHLNSLIDIFDEDSIALIESLTTLVRRERAAREFEQHLMYNDWNEKEWQTFFQREPWLFGHGLLYQFLHLIQREALVGGKDMTQRGGQVTDFALRTFSGAASFIALVDIKVPSKLLVEAKEVRNGAHRIHQDLAEAVAQIQSNCDLWVREGSHQTDNVKAATKSGWQTAQPRGIVVTGRTGTLINESMKQSFELFRRSLHGIEILTFDELLVKAKAMLEHSGDLDPLSLETLSAGAEAS